MSSVMNGQSLTILHISDLQFGRNHRFGNLVPTDLDAQFDTLFQHLSDDLEILTRQGLLPQVIVVSGDIAEWAKRSEFEDALKFLIRLQEHLGVSRRHIVVVLGNHDINWKHCEAYFNDCEGDDEQPIEPYSAKWKHYIWFFEQFYKNEKGVSFNVDQPWTLWEMDGLKLVIAGLNSTMKESHQEGSHYGWVGERQLRWFADRLAPFADQGWFRLGVVHHNALRGSAER
jgi:3',5'-cyclic AMP phosphodiesterase CpdA